MPHMLKSNRGRNKLIDDLNHVYEKQKTNVDELNILEVWN